MHWLRQTDSSRLEGRKVFSCVGPYVVKVTEGSPFISGSFGPVRTPKLTMFRATCLRTLLGVAQSQRVRDRVTQVFIFGSTCQGAILVHVFEPQPFGFHVVLQSKTTEFCVSGKFAAGPCFQLKIVGRGFGRPHSASCHALVVDSTILSLLTTLLVFFLGARRAVDASKHVQTHPNMSKPLLG